MTVKEAELQPVTGLPDYATGSEEQYWAYIRQSIARADAEIAAGLDLTEEEARERLSKWLK